MRIDNSRQPAKKEQSANLKALREFKQLTGIAAVIAQPKPSQVKTCYLKQDYLYAGRYWSVSQ